MTEKELASIFQEAIEANVSERKRLLEKLPLVQRAELEALLAADDFANERHLLSSLNVENNVPSEGQQPKTISNYEIRELIGEGGMGRVYRAYHSRLKCDFAIKLLYRSNSGTQPESAARFEREIAALGGMRHPNIVQATDAGFEEGINFLVMELVEGINLHMVIKQHGRLDVADAAEVVRQTSLGLQHAHAKGLIHRDIKPSNLMISNDGTVKIADMGLALLRNWDSEISCSGQIMGTLDYIAPEQISRPKKVDARADLYSLGCTLYKMLTSKAPFSAPEFKTMFQKLKGHEGANPPSLAKIRPEIPDQIVTIVSRLMAKDPRARFQTADELVHAITPFAGGSHLGKLVCPIETGQDIGDFANALAVGDPTNSLVKPCVETFVDQSESSQKHVLEGTGLSSSTGFPQSPAQVKPVQYARSGSVNIAWQEVGSGPIDIVFVMGWVSHLEYFWKDPGFNSFLMRLASFARVILFDKRGTGLSDRVPIDELPTLETRMDDVRAVMDAAGSKSAVLCGVSEGGPMCSLFAATYPEKTIALVMIGCYARRLWASDYPWGPTPDQRAVFLNELASNWGGPLGIEERAPSQAGDPVFRQWWADYLRMGASPGAAVALTKMNAQIDVRSILPSIQVPTLVIHRTGDQCLKVEEGRLMASLIPGAKFVELPGDDHLPFVGDFDAILDEIEDFLTGKKQSQSVDRVLATVLNVFVKSAVQADLDSDSATKQILSMIVREAELFRGKNLTVDENNYCLTFDGPARAVRAARAIVELAKRLKIEIRCGVDTGPCDLAGGSVSGAAVDKARLISAHASHSTVLVSEPVSNLVSGSGLEFESVIEVKHPISSSGLDCKLFRLISD